MDYPSGQPPNRSPSLVIPNPLKFRSSDIVALGHPSRHSQCLRIPATPSAGAHGETICLRKYINSTLAALTMQLQQLTQLAANPSLLAISNIPPLPVSSPLVSLSPTLLVRQTHPKLSCPLDFNREHYNSHVFLNFCSLYICLAPEQFHNKQERILWALMFFKGGRTIKWSKNMFCQEANTGVFPIQTWGDFKQQFRLYFFLVNVEVDAINTLEGTSYHQGNRIVDNYLDSFQALVSDMGYTNLWTLVVKFR